MSSKLKVQELRGALEKRGLDSSGTKPVLVVRLDAAIASDAQGTDKVAKKRDAEADVEEDSEAVLPRKRGKSTACDGKEHNEEQKLVKATKKGGAVLDPFLPDDIKSGFHVIETDDGIYDAMLNQTNVGANNNKFYLIQALESDAGGKYYVYNRWGRVGVKGQDKLFGPFSMKQQAIFDFEAKFFYKTKNHWAARQYFKPFQGKYTWLERDYTNDAAEEQEAKNKKLKEESKAPVKTPQQSKLDSRLAEFISRICSLSMMRQQMMEIGYDANKMPLGKLSKDTILKGYESLKKIAAVLDGSSRDSLEQLSSDFYTVIPHDFGFQKMRNFIIDTPEKLKGKLEMVEALGEIQIAVKLLQEEGGGDDDPAYSHYLSLQCQLEPIDHDCEEFGWIKQYFMNTREKTTPFYGLELLNVFRATREGEEERFKKFSQVKNRMLLWHGSRLTNWAGILSQGLRIAPPEAPATDKVSWFGKGVYFADMASTSAGYCRTSKRNPIGVLLLCEVALGEMRELLELDHNANNLPKGKLSTKGVGFMQPNPSESKVLPDGVVVPMGKPIEKPGRRGVLGYNEYIVYNVDQIRMRYVLQVKFQC